MCRVIYFPLQLARRCVIKNNLLINTILMDGMDDKYPGGDSKIKKVGVLVVSLRGVNFRFWSRLGC